LILKFNGKMAAGGKPEARSWRRGRKLVRCNQQWLNQPAILKSAVVIMWPRGNYTAIAPGRNGRCCRERARIFWER